MAACSGFSRKNTTKRKYDKENLVNEFGKANGIIVFLNCLSRLGSFITRSILDELSSPERFDWDLLEYFRMQGENGAGLDLSCYQPCTALALFFLTGKKNARHRPQQRLHCRHPYSIAAGVISKTCEQCPVAFCHAHALEKRSKV
jgi:hypothetical protein